jgi:two-component system chemotaxis response regulator CheB
MAGGSNRIAVSGQLSVRIGGTLPGHDIITIGTSAGGVEALITLVKTLPRNLPASIFIVMHTPAHSPSLLATILSRSGPLPACQPEDGEAIGHGCIYVAAPDCHLLVQPGHVHIKHGPKENRHRPAIDPLFRSAARAYGPRVVGVVLTGALDDGTAGLRDIKLRGGTAVVQDPKDAFYPNMPRNAIENVNVDHVKPLIEIGPLLAKLASLPAKEEGAYPVPEKMHIEAEVAESIHTGAEIMDRLGSPSYYACPECHGTLWELNDDDILRYRCRVGHAFTADSLMAAHSEALEEALYAALRALEESASLSRRLAERATNLNHSRVARNYLERARDTDNHANIVRTLLQRADEVGDTEIAG